MTTSEDPGATVLRARRVRVELPGAKSGILRRRGGPVRALDGLDLELRAADTVWLVSASGQGATDAGRVLVGELAPTSGTVELAGQDIATLRGRKRSALARQVVRIVRGEGTLDLTRTAVEIVAGATAGSSRKLAPEVLTDARDLLGQLGLGVELSESPTEALSPDDRRLVDVARVLALRPKVVVYDAVVDPGPRRGPGLGAPGWASRRRRDRSGGGQSAPSTDPRTGRPGAGAVRGSDRGGARVSGPDPPAASLRGDPARTSGWARAPRRRAAQPERPAQRVRLPHAVLQGAGPVQHRGAPTGASPGSHAPGRLPLPRGDLVRGRRRRGGRRARTRPEPRRRASGLHRAHRPGVRPGLSERGPHRAPPAPCAS